MKQLVRFRGACSYCGAGRTGNFVRSFEWGRWGTAPAPCAVVAPSDGDRCMGAWCRNAAVRGCCSAGDRSGWLNPSGCKRRGVAGDDAAGGSLPTAAAALPVPATARSPAYMPLPAKGTG